MRTYRRSWTGFANDAVMMVRRRCWTITLQPVPDFRRRHGLRKGGKAIRNGQSQSHLDAMQRLGVLEMPAARPPPPA